MNRTLTTKVKAIDKKVFVALTLCIVIFVALTLAQDRLRSYLKNSAFYFSESFMFSSFWLIVAPLLFAQYAAIKQKIVTRWYLKILIVLLPVGIHLFAFPFLVWTISGIFYYHTFAFQQTLEYTLSEHLYQMILMYTLPVLAYQFFTKKLEVGKKILTTEKQENISGFIDTIIVADGNKRLNLVVSEAFYFAASPPYISIHLADKKYLNNETLKSISLKLNPEQFVRVHKSTIINIKMVASYTTRLNGDYDLIMKNNVTLRISRNFAADFKNLFNNTHRLTTK